MTIEKTPSSAQIINFPSHRVARSSSESIQIQEGVSAQVISLVNSGSSSLVKPSGLILPFPSKLAKTASLNASLGRRIHVLCLQQKISQQDLANRTNIPLPQIQAYVAGETPIHPLHCSKIAEGLNVLVGELFANIESQGPDTSADMSLFPNSPDPLYLIKKYHQLSEEQRRNLCKPGVISEVTPEVRID